MSTSLCIIRPGKDRLVADLTKSEWPSRFGRLTFGGAVAAQQVRQRVVAFVTRILVDGSGRARHRQFTFPRLRKRGGVVDFEPVEQRVGVEQTEPLDQVKVPVPSEGAARVAVD